MLPDRISKKRISVKKILRPCDPVFVNAFWNGDAALIASSRLPTVKSRVIRVIRPRTAL